MNDTNKTPGASVSTYGQPFERGQHTQVTAYESDHVTVRTVTLKEGGGLRLGCSQRVYFDPRKADALKNTVIQKVTECTKALAMVDDRSLYIANREQYTIEQKVEALKALADTLYWLPIGNSAAALFRDRIDDLNDRIQSLIYRVQSGA